MTLDDVLKRAAAGDIDAFEEVVRETARGVRAYLALHVRDEDSVNDLTQETYLYAFERLRDFRPGTDFRAWLKAIARTQALRTWRERQRKTAAHGRYLAAISDRLSLRAEEIEGHSPIEGLLDRVKGCLAKLASHAREIVRLRYFEGQPLEEIARRQGKTVNGVSVVLSRVRHQLAACAEQSGSQT